MIKVLFTIIGLQIVVVLTGDISQNVFGQERHYLPAAFGDFNSDGLTDVFVLQGNKQLSVLLASDKEPLLRYSPSFSCTFDEFIIISVVPGDFDGDAFMDIMITTQNVLPSQTKNTIVQQVRIIWGGVDKLNCSIDSLPALATIKGQPLALDYDGNMIIDLFGVNENGERTFWVFGHNRTLPSQILMSEKTRDSVKVPHSHSFLDINGDYTSDLVITSPTMFEVWLGQTAEPNFRFSHGIRMPVGISGHIGQAIFLDVELSGKLYLLVPLCYDKNCINSTILINDGEMWNPLFINFQDENMNTWGFVPPNNELFTDTITMRGGDYNMDGYPDLLVVLKSGKDFSTYQSFLMENIPCENKACNFIRTYKIMWTALNPFKKGVVLSAFYDFYQDGILDFIVLQKNNTNNEYTIGALKNTLEYDANFIKVMVLTGLTNAKTPVDDPFGNKKDTYGT